MLALAETASSPAVKVQQVHPSPAEIFQQNHQKQHTGRRQRCSLTVDGKLQISVKLEQPHQFARWGDCQQAGGYGQ